jgi:pyruvate,water dikinase
MPADIQKEIITSYERLSELCGIADVPVSVRSSGPVSYPGLFETYLNVRGNLEIIQKVVRCWASVFSSQAIAMRAQKGLAVDTEPIGVGIQRMVKTRSAGVLFSCHPITGDITKAVIESSWGLGTSVVQATVAPDRFTVNKGTLSIEGRIINQKDKQVLPDKQGIKVKPVPPDKQAQPSLSDDEIVELVRLAKVVEQHYSGIPQNIEWVVADELPFPDNIFLVQARPAVGIGTGKSDMTKPKDKGESDHILDLMIKRFYR